MSEPVNRPNILFLMSDEHRADVTGYEGNEIIRTPVLDELARTGVVFRNAYTASPICVPARQSILSGQLPRTCGCECYGQDLPPGYMTYALRLAQYAYYTVCCGKLGHVGRDQMQGWLTRLAPDAVMDEQLIPGRVEEEFARYSSRDPQWKWSDAKEIIQARVDDQSRLQRFDRHATQAAIEYLEQHFIDMTYDRAMPQRPLLLKLGLLQSHYPYVCTRERMVYYFNRVRPYVDEPVFDHPFLGQRAVKVGKDVSLREIRRATAAYYGMIEAVDSHYGSVLDAMRQVGQDPDDWIIIYTSDHGEMLGEHGVWEKTKFFEASVRVPLIIRWPRRFQPRIVQENVSLCDLFATLCDLAGIPVPPGLDSRSLVPLMDGQSDEWHTRWHNEAISQFAGRNLMIKRDALKYHWYGPDMPEVLFDLAHDPTERTNLIHEPRYASALRAFRQRRAELGFGPQGEMDAPHKANA